ncbi:helix-turn-helix protein [Tenacibaculum skagerrakense]|uniref:Helix-turn-helix protein n=1 Tax=Tenacibaculum skagerrakense TaxID=186571 RepID=A0A4R2NMA6_9FLAO|nr:helix-turn-helix transcriptional regulator [Tenacibaculum skagerrakense]TCP22374.1 helix-turn-helix protein [Tenacibaculum skagerrakense]
MNLKIDGEFVKWLRKELNLKQQELADKLGVSSRTIQNWEGDKRNIPELAQNVLKNMAIRSNLVTVEQSEGSEELTEDEINFLSDIILLKEEKVLQLPFFQKWLKEKVLAAQIEAINKYKKS